MVKLTACTNYGTLSPKTCLAPLQFARWQVSSLKNSQRRARVAYAFDAPCKQ